jgi:hypothetical protein
LGNAIKFIHASHHSKLWFKSIAFTANEGMAQSGQRPKVMADFRGGQAAEL